MCHPAGSLIEEFPMLQALAGAELRAYYDRLIQKYIPHRKLRW